MKKTFKAWPDLVIKIQDTLPNEFAQQCPRCNKEAIDFIYVGDPESKIGFMDIWCNSCNYGIHISRVKIPDKSQFVPFDTPLSEFPKRIPSFKLISH